jgi:hypothetical protein
MGVSERLRSGSSSSNSSGGVSSRLKKTHADENAQYADQMKQAYNSNPDAFAPITPDPVQPEPSFLQKTGDIAKSAGSATLQGVSAALKAVGTGFDNFERATGLKNVSSAVKGLITPNQYYQPDESHENSYLGNLQNIGSEALSSIKNAGRSAYEGLVQPDQADQRFQDTLNKSTDNLDPVTKYSARFLGNAGTDPLTFVPIPVTPIVKAFRGVKGAAESGFAGKVVKDAKLTPESNVSKYVAEREAIQPQPSSLVSPMPSRLKGSLGGLGDTGNITKRQPTQTADLTSSLTNNGTSNITKEEFKKMADSGEYFIRTVRTPQKDMAGRTSTPAGKIGIELGLSSDTHKGLSGFNLKDQSRMLEWMGKEGWAHENVAVYKGKPTKEQVTLDKGEVEFKPSELVGYVPTKVFKEHGGDFHEALSKYSAHLKLERPSPLADSKYAAERKTIQAPDVAPSTAPGAVENMIPAPVQKQNWFTNLFGNQGVGITPFGSAKRVGEGPVNTADQIVNSRLKNDVQGVKDTIASQARATYQNFVDRLSPLKNVSPETYDTAMDASRANNIANTIVRDKFVTPEGQVVGEGLSNIFKKVARGQDKQFIDYLTLRHAETRLGRNERVYAENLGMTTEKVKARLDMYDKRHPGFAAIAKEWDGFNDNVLQHYGVNEGLISPELYKALREKNPNYSPMQRQFSRSEKPGRNFLSKTTSSSFSGQKAPLKEVSPNGSVRDIVDPRKSTIESVGAWTNAVMRNRTMQTIVDAVKRDPEAFKGRIEIKPVVEEAKQSSVKEMNKLIDEHGVEGMLESLNKDFELLFKKSPNPGANKDNVVRAMIGGHPVELTVHDPELVKTLIGMGPQASNVLIDTLSAFSNATKRGATGLLAPVFAVKGATMDLVQSAIQAKNPIQQAADTIYAIFSGVGDKLNIPGLKNLAEEYRRAGGEYSAALKGDRKLNKSISSMTRDPLLSPKGIAKGVFNTVKAPFRALENVGNIAENAPRIAAYKGELRRLGGERTPDNVRQAMSAARESTVNFSRKGALSHDIEAFVPYNNAAVQGTYRVMKAFKNNPIRTTAAVATLAVLPKMYEYMQFHDDPDYQNLPARERMRFLIVNKNDDGTFTKIPMDPAYNSIGEMTVEALRSAVDKDPNAFKGSMDALANAWLPPAATGALQGITQGSGPVGSLAGAANSTVFAPASAVLSNKSFTGAPIVSQAVSDRSPQYQYDERTSGIAKKIGELSGMSPMQIDYFIRSYGGDPARLLLPLTSQVGAGNTRNTLLKNFIVDPTVTNTLTNDFYSAKDKLNNAYRDNQEVGVPFPSWYDDNLRKEIASTAKGSLSKKLSDISNQKKVIGADKALTAEQKSQNLKVLQSKMNDIYLEINTKLHEKGVPMK